MFRSLTLLLLAALWLPAQGEFGTPYGGAPAVPSGDEDPVSIAGVTSLETVKSGVPFMVTVKVQIEPPYHIYDTEPGKDTWPTSFSFVGDAKETLRVEGKVKAERAPKEHKDEHTEYKYWEGAITFEVPVVATGKVGARIEADITMGYMACTMDGCLSPTEKSAPLVLTIVEGGTAPVEEGPTGGATIEAAPGKRPVARLEPEQIAPGGSGFLLIPVDATEAAALAGEVAPEAISIVSSGVTVTGAASLDKDDEGARLRIPVEIARDDIEEGRLVIAGAIAAGETRLNFEAVAEVRRPLLGFILIAMLAAAIALATPCVFPMVPITISVFTKQEEGEGGPSPVVKASAYCLGIVASFTAIGALFTLALGAAGANTFAQHWLTQLLIGVLFIVFAFSLFGAFELRLPGWITNLTGRADQKGGLGGILMLGLLFAVTTFTCTAPFVGGLLATAAQSGQWTRPVLGMVAFSSVLAFPFFFLALFPSRLKALPRAGGWMNVVKVCMGFIELAAAFKFIGGMDQVLQLDVFTRSFVICAWFAIFLVMGLYLLGLFQLPHDGPRDRIGVTALSFGLVSIGFAVYLIGGLGGEPLNDNIDAFLPREIPGKSPLDREDALIARIKRLGLAAGGSGGESHRLGYAAHFKDDYATARKEAIAADVPLFVNFTGYT